MNENRSKTMNENLRTLKEKLMAIPQSEWFSAPVYKLFRQHHVEILDVTDTDAEDITPIFAIDNTHADRETAIDMLFNATDENPVTLYNGMQVAASY